MGNEEPASLEYIISLNPALTDGIEREKKYEELKHLLGEYHGKGAEIIFDFRKSIHAISCQISSQEILDELREKGYRVEKSSEYKAT